MKFTDKFIKGVKSKSTAYRIYEKGADKGFGLKITPAGSVSFFLQYNINKKTRFYNLGRYPSVTLSEARQRCREARVIIDRGNDPQEQKSSRYGTMSDLFDYYISNMKETNKRSWPAVLRDLQRNCQHIMLTTANEITPHDIRDLLYRIIKRGAKVKANRVRTMLHRCFVLGMQHDNDPKNLGRAVQFNITSNPVAHIPRDPTVERSGERNLSFDEVALLWDAEQMTPKFRAAVRLLLFYGCRPWELMGAEKNEFNFAEGIWEISLSRIKSNTPHVLPITDFSRDLLDDALKYSSDSIYLFPANHDDSKVIGKTTLQRSTDKVTTIDRFTPRDLRRTFKTLTGKIGIEKSIRDRIQNHALSDVSSRHYDRYDYLEEKRRALELWGVKLTEIAV